MAAAGLAWFAWLVAQPGLLLAPGTERAQHGQLLTVEAPGLLDLAPGVLWVVHFTLGGPYFNEFADCAYAAQWNAEKAATLRVEQRASLP